MEKPSDSSTKAAPNAKEAEPETEGTSINLEKKRESSDEIVATREGTVKTDTIDFGGSAKETQEDLGEQNITGDSIEDGLYTLEDVKKALNDATTLENVDPHFIEFTELVRLLGEARVKYMIGRFTLAFNSNIPIYVRRRSDNPERYVVVEGNHRVVAMRRIKEASPLHYRTFKVLLLDIDEERLARAVARHLNIERGHYSPTILFDELYDWNGI